MFRKKSEKKFLLTEIYILLMKEVAKTNENFRKKTRKSKFEDGRKAMKFAVIFVNNI